MSQQTEGCWERVKERWRKKIWEKIKKYWWKIQNLGSKNPLVAAGGTLGTLSGVLVFLESTSPIKFFSAIEQKDPQTILMFIVFLYFLLVAIYSGNKSRIEKELQERAQSFKYDEQGTLYNGSEPNISFRTETFKEILKEISSKTNCFKEILIGAGQKAGVNFANRLRLIYAKEIAAKRAPSPWCELRLDEQLKEWAKYDRDTGWGKITVKLKNNKNATKKTNEWRNLTHKIKDTNAHTVVVDVTHLEGLFEGEGGEMFGHFLAGYFEKVISYIVKHASGEYEEYDSVKINAFYPSKDNDAWVYEYILEIKEDCRDKKEESNSYYYRRNNRIDFTSRFDF